MSTRLPVSIPLRGLDWLNPVKVYAAAYTVAKGLVEKTIGQVVKEQSQGVDFAAAARALGDLQPNRAETLTGCYIQMHRYVPRGEMMERFDFIIPKIKIEPILERLRQQKVSPEVGCYEMIHEAPQVPVPATK